MTAPRLLLTLMLLVTPLLGVAVAPMIGGRRLVAQHHKRRCAACCACKAITTEDAQLQGNSGAMLAEEHCTYDRCNTGDKRIGRWWCWDTYDVRDGADKWGAECSNVPGYPDCASATCAFSNTQKARARDQQGEFQTWNHDSHLGFGGRTGGPIQAQDDDDAER